MSFIQAIITNPVLDGIATIIGCILSIVAIYLALLTRKRLTYGIVSSNPLIDDPNEVLTSSGRNRLNIQYNQRAVFNLYITHIKVKNTGYVNIDLPRSSSGPPITFTFASEILAFGVVKEGSQARDAKLIARNDRTICLTTLLLDKKEQFLFKVISEQKIEDFEAAPNSYIETYKPRKRHEFSDSPWLSVIRKGGYGLAVILLLASFFLCWFMQFSNQQTIIALAFLLLATTIIYLLVLSHNIFNDFIRQITRRHV